MKNIDQVQDLLAFVHNSPTPFHAVKTTASLLLDNGFEQLDEKDAWKLEAGKKYFYSRADSSLIAFVKGRDDVAKTGLRLVGAHTDSPCLKVKPNPEVRRKNYFLLGVEIYGGVLLNPWFDRDLSLAGKVNGLDSSGNFCSALIDFRRAIASVPSLAIHLDRTANKDKTVNPQKEMNVLLGIDDETLSFKELILKQVGEDRPDLHMTEVLDFNLSFYDTQAPQLIGVNNEFIASARLDNLLSSYAGVAALIESVSVDLAPSQTMVFISNDHEEVGSRSEPGAQGTMLTDLIERLVGDTEQRQQALRRSLMLSVDNAHGIHPNYPEKHDDAHGPLINAGPVIKFNANQSYATSSDTAGILRMLARSGESDVPLQSFVVRADMRCGSTIGPVTASNAGIRTVDLGLATFAMHSIRELGGCDDLVHLLGLLKRFYMTPELP